MCLHREEIEIHKHKKFHQKIRKPGVKKSCYLALSVRRPRPKKIAEGRVCTVPADDVPNSVIHSCGQSAFLKCKTDPFKFRCHVHHFQCLTVPAVPPGPSSWKWCIWHWKASDRNSSKLNKFLHSEVNLLIQHIIAQNQDWQNNKIYIAVDLLLQTELHKISEYCGN